METKCEKCGMPLDENVECSCNKKLCCHCCSCGPECENCKCTTKQ